jgi:Ca2+/Na+ antiporter
VTFFVIFGLLLLAFVTHRQFREAESNRLQLLAGLSSRVESTLENLAGRFVQPVLTLEVKPNQQETDQQETDQQKTDQQETSTVEGFLKAVPVFDPLAQPLPAPKDYKSTYPVRLETRGSSVFFTYVAKPGKTFEENGNVVRCMSKVEAKDEDETTDKATDKATDKEEKTKDETKTSLCNYSVEVHLPSVFEPIRPPEGFDALYLVTPDGEILYSYGEPALRVANLKPLLAGEDRFKTRAKKTEDQEPGQTDSSREGFEQMTVTMPTTVDEVKTHIADLPYRAFFQPISIELPRLEGEILPPTQFWVACGVVAEDSLLSSSYASSPVLLFILVAIFPLALLSWPFAKLVLITKRQRFTRFDVGALAFAAVFGLSMLTLMVFGIEFIMRIQKNVESQLKELSDAVEYNFRMEVEDINCQLNRTEHSSESKDTKDAKAGNGVKGAEDSKDAEDAKDTKDAKDAKDILSILQKKPGEYVVYNALFWIDEDGEQQRNEQLLSDSNLKINVADRQYFQCAKKDESSFSPLAFKTATKKGCSKSVKIEGLCIESVLSKISGEDEAVIARPIDSDKLAVFGMSTRLSSLALPVLPEDFGFAIVDSNGKVLFHNDHNRNTIEDFLKANHEDRVLESLIKERRTGHADTRYWGEPHLLYVRPLSGLPWSLVTFWNTRDLRLRAFALAHDFLNPFLVYLAIVVVILMIAVFFLSRDYLENLWPHRRFSPVYRHIVHVVILLASVCAAFLALDDIRVIYLFSTLTPVALLVYFVWRVEAKEEAVAKAAEKARKKAEEETRKKKKEAKEKVKNEVKSEANDESIEELDANKRTWSSDLLYPLSALFLLFALALSATETRDFLILGILCCLFFILIFLTFYRTEKSAIKVVEKAVVKAFTRAVRSLRRLITQSDVDSTGSGEDQGAAKRGKDVVNVPRRIEAMVFFPILFVGAILLNTELVNQFLIGAVAVAVIFFEAYQHRFFFRQRRFAFLSCWSGLLFVVGVLPALGFVTLASSRQIQLAVMDTQLDLFRAIEKRDDSVEKRNEEIKKRLGPPSDGESVYYNSKLKKMKKKYMRCFFPEPEQKSTQEEFTWPKAVSENEKLSGFIAKLMATRLIGVNELTHRATSVDLSRFELAHGCWRAYSNYLEAKVPQEWGQGEEQTLRSSYPPVLDHEDRQTAIGTIYFFLILILGFSPVLIANFIAERVLLVSLVKSGEERNGTWTMEGIVRRVDKLEAKRILLITRIPRLFVQRVTNAEDMSKKVRILPYKKLIRRSMLLIKEEIVLIVNFEPCLEATEDADKEFERFARFLDERKGAVIIISSRDPRELFFGQPPEDKTELKRSVLLQNWEGELAAFEVRYGLHSGESLGKYREEIQEAIDEKEPREVRKKKLASLIAEECGYTQRLQDIGRQMVKDLHPQTYTEEEVRSRIAVLARSYYQTLWDGCSVDEKIVLVRLAEDGLVSSQNYDHLLELLQKGLVRRDPGLRLMNRSFGQFALRSVTRADVQEWEEAGGISAWSVMKWLLPLPLLLFGGFLFVTQRESFSNVMGIAVALGSVTPILVNLFNLFHQATIRTQVARPEGSSG